MTLSLDTLYPAVAMASPGFSRPLPAIIVAGGRGERMGVANFSVRWGRSPILFCMLSLMTFHGPVMAEGSSWQGLLAQAERYSTEGKHHEAVQAARSALADAEKKLGVEAPEVGHILARLTMYSFQTGEHLLFPELEKRLREFGSKDFEIWMALGVLLGREERFVEAENALRKAFALNPDDAWAVCELAIAVGRLGRKEDAVHLLKKGLERHPRDYRMHLELANSYVALGLYAHAKEIFARAKKIDSKEASAYIQEGYALMNAGQDAQAEESFKSLIDVSTPLGYHHMASYFIRSNQLSEAEGHLRRALQELEADENARLYDLLHTINNLGVIVARQGRKDEAAAIFRDGLKRMSPHNDWYPGFSTALAEIYASQGRKAQAEDYFKQALGGGAGRPW